MNKKKSNIITLKLLFLLPCFVLLLFSSCQEEVVDVSPPNEEETLVVGSTLINLMSLTSKLDGSKDNIIDGASCLSVELPVTVFIKGLEIIINSEDDYSVIEAFYDEFEGDEDKLDIVFPITMILSDYKAFTIVNAEDFNELVASCAGENEDDDDIECIDFKYPMSFSTFNTDFQVLETITIENDMELHLFITDVKVSTNILASVNFPITMSLTDGTENVVNNNNELEQAIEEAKDLCDEDDDNDYGDDDFTKNELDTLLMTGPWDLYQFIREGEDLSIEYENYKMIFNEGDVINILTPENTIHQTGLWSTRQTTDGVLLSINFNDNSGFDFEWTVYELASGKIQLFKSSDGRLTLNKN